MQRICDVLEERLKPLDQVTLPDSRAELFSVADPESQALRSVALADLYARANAIELHDGVPEFIRSHFATAKNLLVYAWFFYPFTVTAHLLSMVSIEYALRVRFEADPGQGFKSLVRRAVKEGLVQDAGFTHLTDTNYSGSQSFPAASSGEQDVTQEARRYVDDLIEVLPSLRNVYAHGRHTVMPFSSLPVQIAADFINQLYTRP